MTLAHILFGSGAGIIAAVALHFLWETMSRIVDIQIVSEADIQRLREGGAL